MWNSLEAVVIILFGMELYSCPVILVRLNCGDSLWLGNDTVSLWHGTSVSITVDQCLRKRKFDKEKERLYTVSYISWLLYMV